MGRPILLLRLEGPLQSWGARARWDVRDTAPEPTKSGVLGLLGCALGLERGNQGLLELDASLRFGVRVENAGRVLNDYQTITGYLPTAGGEWKGRDNRMRSPTDMRAAQATPATILSPRDYLEDAAFLVGLEAYEGGDACLERAANAIQAPRWPLFLGRKACIPSRPLYECFDSKYQGLEEALQTHEWDWLGALSLSGGEVASSGRKEPRRLPEAWIETDDLNDARAVLRQDALTLNPARVYGFRLTKSLDHVKPRNLTHLRIGQP